MQKGRQYVLEHDDGINIISQSLYKSNTKVKWLLGFHFSLEICFLAENKGHEKALNAMKYYKKYSNERLRFQVWLNLSKLI